MTLQLTARRITVTIEEKNGVYTTIQLTLPSNVASGKTVAKLRWALEQAGFAVRVKNEWENE